MSEIDWENPFKAEVFLDEENRAAGQALEASCLFPVDLVSQLGGLGEIAATNANAKFQRILAQGVRVYGAANKYSPAMMTWETYQTPGHHTHRGIVINIEEVKDA